MSDEAAEPRPVGRLYLEGARFEGGRLPIDALIEVERYQKLVIESARLEWLKEHPDEEIPADFEKAFSLSITEIGEGSAALVLELDQPVADEIEPDVSNDVIKPVKRIKKKDVSTYFSRGLRQLENELRAVARPETSFNELPLLGRREFQDLGSSLDRGEALRVVADREPKAEAPVLTPVLREERLEPLVQDFEAEREKQSRREKRRIAAERNQTTWTPIAGRLVSLSPDNETFRVNSLRYGVIKGSYSSPDLLADLRRVLDSNTRAPVVRMQALLQTQDGKPWRIKDVRAVELLEIDGRPWSRRFIELAQLDDDWGGEVEGAKPISFAAIDIARALMVRAEDELGKRPALFPTEEGGLLLEWSSSQRLVSVEVSPDGEFDLLSLVKEGHVVEQDTTDNVAVVFGFVAEALA